MKFVSIFKPGGVLERKHEEIVRDGGLHVELDLDGLDDEIGDDLLRLIFIACHPVLSVDARVALTLRLRAGGSARSEYPGPRVASRARSTVRVLLKSIPRQ